jgi:protein-S-isoprenylcysteine O-methyltransferase Ste14
VAAVVLGVIHYSRLSVGFAAAAMTAASSIGFLGVIRYRTAITVGLCTLAAYWFDDLVDLARDESRNPALRVLHPLRLGFLVSGLATAAVCQVWLLARESKPLIILLGVLALLTTAYCLRRAFGRLPAQSPIPYWAQAIGWSVACVLSPQLAAGAAPNLQTWLSLGYFLLLIFPVIDLWRNPSPQPQNRVRLLVGQCVVAAFMVVIAVSFHWTSWLNIAMIAAPAINLLMLWVRQRATIASVVVSTELTVIFNTLCALLIIGANQSGMKLQQAGPRSAADYFQLASVAALSILIAGNFLLRRSRGVPIVYREDSFSVLVTLGFAVFAFQSMQAACHLQAWLLPWFSTRLFEESNLGWLGAGLMAACIVAVAASYFEMGPSWRIGIDERVPGALVTSGLFRRSRNPIYLSADLFIAGSFLLNPTLAGLIYLVLTPAVLHAQITREEAFLQAVHGQQFAAYAAITPRYI